MSASLVMVVLAGVLLAYANGANDVSKGVATLVGSGVSDTRRAVAWGAFWTGLGGLLGSLLARAMLVTFGNGLMEAGAAPTAAVPLASLLGAAGWVWIATRQGVPVSTTHALVGSVVAVAAVAHGPGAVRWNALAGKIVLPLLLTPLVAVIVTSVLLRVNARRSARAEPADCLCVEAQTPPATADRPWAALAVREASRSLSAAAVPAFPAIRLFTGSRETCRLHHPRARRLTIDHLHWFTSGATSLARGMNDAPKIVALVLSAVAAGGDAAVGESFLHVAVTGGMIVGSLVAGLRVTAVLAKDVTSMDHRDGFSANLVTAALVIVGAVKGLAMSTTHVASGTICGVGARRGTLHLDVIRQIALAWIVTAPAAGLLGMASYLLAGTVLG